MRIATTLLVVLWTGTAAAQCAPDLVTLKGDFGQARFKVAVADDLAERAQGLMNVPEMPRMSGMLFVYEAPQTASFWMRNTLIPLDMIFASADGTVQTVHAKAIPHDETPILGGDDIKYVLEINGGLAGRLGIEPGTVMQHPAIGPNAALPCGD
ncbi:DUF192 domain-containing protein [Loktanella sp. DJP18]|uniref:DUF192 domain-containing protein n=1 Tax=Loktanella sp. DJP18 TaxID=3409788 RepID=UPI003BB6A71C